MTQTRATEALTALAWIDHYWPDLAESRSPGTARPRRRLELTPERQRLVDAAAHIERLERSPLALGDSPAPLNFDALDLMAVINTKLLGLAHILPGIDVRALPRYANNADPTKHIAAVTESLRTIDSPLPRDDDGDFDDNAYIIGQATDITTDLAQRLAAYLGMVYDGQHLAVVCPWCHGITAWAPEGGEHTWRVRILPPELIAIVCESGTCEPPADDIGTWWKSYPVWPIWRWEWLAARL